MKTLEWDQVNAWRISQHFLSNRLKRLDFIQAMERTGGIQAQVMSAAEMACGARVDGLSPQDVQGALWQERTLIKTWAMRGTLHILSASDLPLYVAARSLYDDRYWVYYFDYYGIKRPEYEAFLAVAPQILSSQPMTREQLAAALAEQTGSVELRDLITTKGWGTPLKPLAWRGDLCFGPNQGQNVTFVHPSQWAGGWQPVEPYPALQEIARRYLRAYGPAVPEDFARWWGTKMGPTRKLFRSIEDELETVDVEGWRAFALRETLEPMQNSAPMGTVNLLPFFDAYVLGIGHSRNIDPILPKMYFKTVYRPQGWISAVVSVDGSIKGTWEIQKQRAQTAVQVRLFSPVSEAIKEGIEAEAERMGAFLNTKIALEYEQV